MQPYRVIGIESSPYAVKVRSVMRYRHLPYRWVARMPQLFDETHEVRPPIMPVVQFPDGEYRTDSTPVIRALETLHPDSRSVIPPDPGHAFLSDLIEDFADEWLTKSLFHYRFSRPADRLSGGGWVMDDAHPDLDHAALAARTEAFVERQVGRMPLVGCTPANAARLEASYLATLDALESHVATDRFLFGSRPSLADFGLYAQLSTLGNDPTPMLLMRERAPRTWHWVLRLGDASGVDGAWADADGGVPPVVAALLRLAGRWYLPFLTANARAIAAGADTVELELDGEPWVQPVFRYQAKCRDYLVRQYAALPAAVAGALDGELEASGCREHLEPV